MMKRVFHIATIFPEFFDSPLKVGNISRAIEKGLLEVLIHNIRDYTTDPRGKVDDKPYGGGPGMVMSPEPFFRLCMSIAESDEVEAVKQKIDIILLTPRGVPFSQKIATEIAASSKPKVILCGRYEGIDNRVAEALATREISIGDYVLSGGEPAALVILDAIVRLIPGVVGSPESILEESLSEGLLEYPQYTRPEEFMGFKVPPVLTSGNHRLINIWRLRRQIIETFYRRPDLFERFIENEDKLKEVEKKAGKVEEIIKNSKKFVNYDDD